MRPVYVNGTYCESMVAGARKATEILGKEVSPWQMQRVTRGDLKIGVDITEKPPQRKQPASKKKIAAKKNTGAPLLRYPHGETPCERGLPRIWR